MSFNLFAQGIIFLVGCFVVGRWIGMGLRLFYLVVRAGWKAYRAEQREDA